MVKFIRTGDFMDRTEPTWDEETLVKRSSLSSDGYAIGIIVSIKSIINSCQS